jgi:hypothetical protein
VPKEKEMAEGSSSGGTDVIYYQNDNDNSFHAVDQAKRNGSFFPIGLVLFDTNTSGMSHIKVEFTKIVYEPGWWKKDAKPEDDLCHTYLIWKGWTTMVVNVMMCIDREKRFDGRREV